MLNSRKLSEMHRRNAIAAVGPVAYAVWQILIDNIWRVRGHADPRMDAAILARELAAIVSYDLLVVRIGVGREAIARAIQRLVAAGWITVRPAKGPARERPSLYVLGHIEGNCDVEILMAYAANTVVAPARTPRRAAWLSPPVAAEGDLKTGSGVTSKPADGDRKTRSGVIAKPDQGWHQNQITGDLVLRSFNSESLNEKNLNVESFNGARGSLDARPERLSALCAAQSSSAAVLCFSEEPIADMTDRSDRVSPAAHFAGKKPAAPVERVERVERVEPVGRAARDVPSSEDAAANVTDPNSRTRAENPMRRNPPKTTRVVRPTESPQVDERPRRLPRTSKQLTLDDAGKQKASAAMLADPRYPGRQLEALEHEQLTSARAKAAAGQIGSMTAAELVAAWRVGIYSRSKEITGRHVEDLALGSAVARATAAMAIEQAAARWADGSIERIAGYLTWLMNRWKQSPDRVPRLISNLRDYDGSPCDAWCRYAMTIEGKPPKGSGSKGRAGT